jgi:GNAT superfamily N-acetyltransferase
MFLRIYNQSMQAHWGFVPLGANELKALAGGLKRLMVPELVSVAESEGKVIGSCFCLPDYNPVIKQINGRLFPFGFLKLLGAKKKVRRVRLIATNVLPEYQSLGVGLALLYGLLPHALEHGIQEGEFSWVSECNDLSRKSIERGGVPKTNTYRIYDWPETA